MFNIPTVLTADELMDKAFRRAGRVTVADPDRRYRLKKVSIGKLQSVAQTLDASLSSTVKSFPSFGSIHPFQMELSGLTVDLDRLKRSLGALDWARKKVLEISGEELRRMRRSRDPEFINGRREAAYGRIASIIKQVRKDLDLLSRSRDLLRKLPTIHPEAPTVVIAGFPNVGKSLLVSKLSTAKPEVAPYPFTTKGIIIGHIASRWTSYQVIDTPGLLDRPLERRNPIELQAVLALRHLADVLVFLIDPTGLCGASVGDQERLLERLREEFPRSELIVVGTKADLKRWDGGTAISALTGEGMEELRKLVLGKLRAVEARKSAESAGSANSD